MKNTDTPFVFMAVTGFADWAADMSEDDLAPYFCDPSSRQDIERWFAEIMFPPLENSGERGVESIAHYLEMVDRARFEDLYAQELSNLSPVPFTTDPDLQEAFFRHIAELLQDSIS